MSNPKKYYDAYDSSNRSGKSRNNEMYSSTDYIPGKIGKFVKLLTGFIIYVISLSIQLVIFSPLLYFNEMHFIIFMSFAIMIIVWGTTILLEHVKNIYKLLIILVAISLSFFISPYSILLTIIFSVLQFVTALISFSRMKLPEKIGLSHTLIIISCVSFCIVQILFSIDVFKCDSSMQLKPIMITTGIIWIIISVFMLNIINVKRISNTNRKLSKGLLYGNITMSALFIGLVLIISSIDHIKAFIMNIIKKIIVFLFSGSNAQEVPTETLDQQVNMDISLLGEAKKTSLFMQIMEKILIIIGVLITVILLFYLLRLVFKKLKKAFVALLNYLNRNDENTSRLEFSDAEESTFDRTTLNEIIRNRFDKFKKRLKAKPKLSDLKNNRQKVRLIYKFILQKEKDKNKPVENNTTARELLTHDEFTSDKEIFLNGYEKARYSNHKISDEEVDAGINLINSK